MCKEKSQGDFRVGGINFSKLKSYTTACCTYPPGGFCAGGEKQGLRHKVKEHLKEKGEEYTGDNVILALFDMNYIDYNKIWKKKA